MDTLVDGDGNVGVHDEVVLTHALRSLRQSALRCRRARLIIDEPTTTDDALFDELARHCADPSALACSAPGGVFGDRRT
jgi:hypothetical protein